MSLNLRAIVITGGSTSTKRTGKEDLAAHSRALFLAVVLHFSDFPFVCPCISYVYIPSRETGLSGFGRWVSRLGRMVIIKDFSGLVNHAGKLGKAFIARFLHCRAGTVWILRRGNWGLWARGVGAWPEWKRKCTLWCIYLVR